MLQRQMSEYNYEAGIQMTMATVSRNYSLVRVTSVKRLIAGKEILARIFGRRSGSLSSNSGWRGDRGKPGTSFYPSRGWRN
jgi:hypothetical protein